VAATRTVRSVDGRTWTIDAGRFRPPRWRESDYEPQADDLFFGIFEYAFAIVVWFVVPLLIAIVELPVAVVRSLVSSRRWVRAVSDDTHPVTILWSAHRDDAKRIVEEIASRLSTGYEDVTPEGAVLVEMSEPPGFADRPA
jgi:hypothetical protein